MGSVEAKMLAYIERRLEEGALSVTGAEILDAVIPPDQPEFLGRPAYRFGLERLRRRHVINAVARSTTLLGPIPYVALSKSLGI